MMGLQLEKSKFEELEKKIMQLEHYYYVMIYFRVINCPCMFFKTFYLQYLMN